MGEEREGGDVRVRIVSWNLNRATWQGRRRFATAVEHAHAAWSAAAGLSADVAMFQEASPPPADLARPPVTTIPAASDEEEWRSLPGPQRRWSTAIASWGPDLS